MTDYEQSGVEVFPVRGAGSMDQRSNWNRRSNAMVTKRPLRPCRQVGCPNLVRPPAVYCQEHQHLAVKAERERQRYYDRHVRDKEAAAFYRSPEWQALRQLVLQRDRYLCVMCLEDKRITRAVAVDHIVPIRQDWARRLDPLNCRSLCLACHNKVRREQG